MFAFDLNQVTENRIFFRTAVLRKLSDITDSHTNTEIPHAVAYSSTVTRSKHRNNMTGGGGMKILRGGSENF